MTSVSQAMPTTSRRASRVVYRVLGDVFMGIALGLLAYYGVTNLQTAAEQSALRQEAPAGVYSEAVSTTGPRLDFSGWEGEDRAYWEGLKKGETMGRITAGRMKLDTLVVKGVRRADLKKGPGWIDYTSYPGPSGNTGISGHRTTYGAPFRKLDRMRTGDTIIFYSPFRRYTYRVRRVFSVTPDRVDVVADTKTPTLTLTACHPPYSARLRLIVQSDLIEVKRLAK